MAPSKATAPIRVADSKKSKRPASHAFRNQSEGSFYSRKWFHVAWQDILDCISYVERGMPEPRPRLLSLEAAEKVKHVSVNCGSCGELKSAGFDSLRQIFPAAQVITSHHGHAKPAASTAGEGTPWRTPWAWVSPDVTVRAGTRPVCADEQDDGQVWQVYTRFDIRRIPTVSEEDLVACCSSEGYCPLDMSEPGLQLPKATVGWIAMIDKMIEGRRVINHLGASGMIRPSYEEAMDAITREYRAPCYSALIAVGERGGNVREEFRRELVEELMRLPERTVEVEYKLKCDRSAIEKWSRAERIAASIMEHPEFKSALDICLPEGEVRVACDSETDVEATADTDMEDTSNEDLEDSSDTYVGDSSDTYIGADSET